MKPAAWLVCFCLLSPALQAEEPGSSGARSSHWNIRTTPLGWVLGPNARIDYKLAAPLTAGVGFSVLDRKVHGIKLQSFNTALFVNYYFREAFVSSWFLGLGLHAGKLKGEVTDAQGQLDSRSLWNLGSQFLAGHHWFWGAFNLSFGAGVESNSAGHAEIRDASGSTVDTIPLQTLGFASEAAIGFTF